MPLDYSKMVYDSYLPASSNEHFITSALINQNNNGTRLHFTGSTETQPFYNP
jgi:hypothetical protein